MDQFRYGYLFWRTCTTYYAARNIAKARHDYLAQAARYLSACMPENSRRDLKKKLENAQSCIQLALSPLRGRRAQSLRNEITVIRNTLFWDRHDLDDLDDTKTYPVRVLTYQDYYTLGYLFWLTHCAYVVARAIPSARKDHLEDASHHLAQCVPNAPLTGVMAYIDDAQHNVFMSLTGIFVPDREYVCDLIRIVRTSLMILE